MLRIIIPFSFFFFNDTATTEIYTLSLHDALPISHAFAAGQRRYRIWSPPMRVRDRKSTRLTSSHGSISYAGFCLKKKTQNTCAVLSSDKERIVTTTCHGRGIV